jgi:hypothetical protein
MPLAEQEAVPPGADLGIEVTPAPPKRPLAATNWVSSPEFTDDIDSRIAREAVQDTAYTKTWSRLLVEGFLQHVSLFGTEA